MRRVDGRRGMDAPQLTEELEFLRVVWLVDHAIQGASRRMLDTIGLTGPQRLALRIVSTNPGLSPGDLARILHLHPSTLTGIFQRLEARKLIERRADPTDARRAQLFTTRAGAGLVTSLSGTLEQAVKRTIARWSRRDVHRVKALLTDLAGHVTIRPARRQTAEAR